MWPLGNWHKPEQAIHLPLSLYILISNFLCDQRDQCINENLPCGSIEAYGFILQMGDGFVESSAAIVIGTMPKHLAIFPDGRYAVVAIHGEAPTTYCPSVQTAICCVFPAS